MLDLPEIRWDVDYEIERRQGQMDRREQDRKEGRVEYVDGAGGVSPRVRNTSISERSEAKTITYGWQAGMRAGRI